MAKVKAVMILFPELTHSGKQYSKGTIEENPTTYLKNAAKEKIKQYQDLMNFKEFCRLDLY